MSLTQGEKGARGPQGSQTGCSRNQGMSIMGYVWVPSFRMQCGSFMQGLREKDFYLDTLGFYPNPCHFSCLSFFSKPALSVFFSQGPHLFLWVNGVVRLWFLAGCPWPPAASKGPFGFGKVFVSVQISLVTIMMFSGPETNTKYAFLGRPCPILNNSSILTQFLSHLILFLPQRILPEFK